MDENRRQRDVSERQALARLRQGDPAAYLAHAASQGRLHLEHDPTDAKQRLLEDWWQTARHDLSGSVMLAYHRDEVRDLNEAARTLLARAGRLGPDSVETPGKEFRVGDRVLCRRNDRALGVTNGTRATIVDLGPTQLTLRTDTGSLRSLPLDYAAEQLEHAYALTGHAAQGATLNHAYVLLKDHGNLREWGYVALSRARTDTNLYLAERDPLERETPLRDPSATTPPERAARALERSAAEPLAIDQSRKRRDPKMKILDQQREQLDELRERMAERLTAGRQELKTLHWWNRGSRAELESQVARDRFALQRAEAKRDQLHQHAQRRLQFLALSRERDEVAPSLRPEPTRPRLEREPGRGLEL